MSTLSLPYKALRITLKQTFNQIKMRMCANYHRPHDAIDLFYWFFFQFSQQQQQQRFFFWCSQLGWISSSGAERSGYSASPMCAEALYSRSLTWMRSSFRWTDRATGWVSHWADQYCTQRGFFITELQSSRDGYGAARRGAVHATPWDLWLKKHPTWLLTKEVAWQDRRGGRRGHEQPSLKDFLSCMILQLLLTQQTPCSRFRAALNSSVFHL